MTRIDREDIWSNLLAIYLLAQTLYPGLSGESVYASIQDGTIWIKLLNVAFAFVAARHKGRRKLS